MRKHTITGICIAAMFLLFTVASYYLYNRNKEQKQRFKYETRANLQHVNDSATDAHLNDSMVQSWQRAINPQIVYKWRTKIIYKTRPNYNGRYHGRSGDILDSIGGTGWYVYPNIKENEPYQPEYDYRDYHNEYDTTKINAEIETFLKMLKDLDSMPRVNQDTILKHFHINKQNPYILFQ